MEEILTFFLTSILEMLRLLFLDPLNLFLFFLLFLNTIGYVLILALLAKLRPGNGSNKKVALDANDWNYPLVSVIIPASNEEKVIERKLENIYSLKYPSDLLEVIVVDDGSTDQTPIILRNLQETRFPNLKVITQNRKGKSAAENVGLREAKGEIIVISDADVPLNSEALLFAIRDFKDPQVGGVTCSVQAGERYVMALNLDTALYARQLENKIDSIFGMSGPFVAFRKSIISQIDEGIFSSDTDLGLRVRSKGFKVVFDSNIVSHVDQWIISRPKTISGALRKMKHLSFGSLALFVRHRGIILRKSLGLFGLIIVPRHLFLNVFAPVFFVLLSANFIFRLIESSLFLPFISLVSLFLLVTFILRKLSPNLVTKLFYLLFMYVVGYYAQFLYYVMFLLSSSQRRGMWKGVR